MVSKWVTRPADRPRWDKERPREYEWSTGGLGVPEQQVNGWARMPRVTIEPVNTRCRETQGTPAADKPIGSGNRTASKSGVQDIVGQEQVNDKSTWSTRSEVTSSF